MLLGEPTNYGRKKAFITGTTEGDLPMGLRVRMDKWFTLDGSFLPNVIPLEIVAEFADWRDSYMFKEAKLDRRDADLQRIHKAIRKEFELEYKKLNLQS